MIDLAETEQKEEDTRQQIVISDTDFLSSFLWRNQFGIVIKLFGKPGMDIIIPEAVMEELNYSTRTRERLAGVLYQLDHKKDKKHGRGEVYIQDIEPFSYACMQYEELKKTLVKGEAAAISMVLHSEEKVACLASNNLRDVRKYVEDNQITLWTTAGVLEKAELLGIVTHDTAVKLWDKMYEDGLSLPKCTYEEYVRKKKAV